jgi:hypothetical protein
MAGQISINFEGLSPEAASQLANGMASAVKAKIEAIGAQVTNLQGEDAARFERLMSSERFADGNCGNGCAG